ncbi:hypothetical protein ENBRE01_2836 [Enteropsectra breve]|nr:hypothetical protein ENBRE01_2836 [Enteropsectra breve]
MIFPKVELLKALLACSGFAAADRQNPDTKHDLHSKQGIDADRPRSEIVAENAKVVQSMKADLDSFVKEMCDQYKETREKYHDELWGFITKIGTHKAIIQKAAGILDSETINNIRSKESVDEYDRMLLFCREAEDISNSLQYLKLEAFSDLLERSTDDDFAKACPLIVQNLKDIISTKYEIFKVICLKSRNAIKELKVINAKIIEEIATAKHEKTAGKWKEFMEVINSYINQALEKHEEVRGLVNDDFCERFRKFFTLRVEIDKHPQNKRTAYDEEVKAIKDSLKAQEDKYCEFNFEVSSMKDMRAELEKHQQQGLSNYELYQEGEKCFSQAKKILDFVTAAESNLADTDSKLESLITVSEVKTEKVWYEEEAKPTTSAEKEKPFWKIW